MSTRPRGDVTTVIDLASRNGQDDYFFPINSNNSWFHRNPGYTTYPATMASQEFTHKGTAAWGGRLTFELGALQVGDLIQSIAVQIRLGHWYSQQILQGIAGGQYRVDPSSNPWTYINSLGTSIIDYAEFEVGDQTLERIDGQFIKAYSALIPDANMLFGFSSDGYGITSLANVANNTAMMNPNRPWPTQDGVYFCLLPFFFMRTRQKECFPLVACAEGSVRVHVQLRTFAECVRSSLGFRESCDSTPLGTTTNFLTADSSFSYVSSTQVPAFQDFRVLTYTGLISETVRKAYIHKPFEQLTKFVISFYFDEPYKYLSSKRNSNSDTIEVSLPLELNHPTQEIFWVFRRKATVINNEWFNYSPITETQYDPISVPKQWLDYATLRVNGMVVQQAAGEWWRQSISKAHKGGWNAWAAYSYGYSFAINPDEHQPSGSINMSRASSVRLDLRVNVPKMVNVPPGFDLDVGQGWEVFVYAVHLNWLRFENGLCQKLFED
jgi:Large eukaryotic DNA virus major capsid protein/Major capsid protein N-terminus